MLQRSGPGDPTARFLRVRVQGRRERDDRLDPIGVSPGKMERNQATEGMCRDHRGLVQRKLVETGHERVNMPVRSVTGRRTWRFTETEKVGNDKARAIGQ